MDRRLMIVQAMFFAFLMSFSAYRIGLSQGQEEGAQHLKEHEQNHEEALRKIGICEWAKQTMCKD